MSVSKSWLLQCCWHSSSAAWAWNVLERTYLYRVTGDQHKSRWCSEDPGSHRCQRDWAAPLGEAEGTAEIGFGWDRKAMLFFMLVLAWKGRYFFLQARPRSNLCYYGNSCGSSLGMADFQNSGLAIWETSLVFGSELIIPLKLNV